MTENNVHHGADNAPESTSVRRTFAVPAVDGTIVDSPAPMILGDGYAEIFLGDRSDHRLNVMLARNDEESFWRIHLPDHDDSAVSTVELQNRICRLVVRATSLCLLLNGNGVSGGPAAQSAGAEGGEQSPRPTTRSSKVREGGENDPRAATLDDFLNVADSLGVSPVELFALRTAAKRSAEAGAL